MLYVNGGLKGFIIILCIIVLCADAFFRVGCIKCFERNMGTIVAAGFNI